MSSESNSMVPGTHWGGLVDEFDKGMGKQDLLCAPCAAMGVLVPPRYIVISDGESLCIDHFNARTHAHG